MKNKMKVIGNIYCAGVYGIRCKDSDTYLYVGSAIEINDALSRHLHYLKRGLYKDTNKTILQEKYDAYELVFEIIKTSCFDKVSEMTTKEKEDLQKELSVFEQFYIGLYKDTVCNCQKSVTKHSSNKNILTRYKRRQANLGEKNPNCCVLTEETASEILWLKQNTKMKNKEIADIYKCKDNLVSRIGRDRWLSVEPIMPSWYKEESASIGVDTLEKIYM